MAKAGTSRAKSVAEYFGLDLLDQVRLLMNLEDEFEIPIADEDVVKLRKVGNVLEVMCCSISTR